MTDIVERLRELERVERELAHDSDCPPEATANWRYAETCKSAAAEIEKLRAALRPFAWYADNLVPQIDNICGEWFYKSLKDARAALKEDGE